MVARDWPNRMLEFLLKGFSPGWWAYVSNFADKQLHLDSISVGAYSQNYTVEGLIDLISHDPFSINVQNIDWKDRDTVQKSIERGQAILKAWDQQLDDLLFIDSGSGFDIY